MTQPRQAPSQMRWIPVAVFAYLFVMSVSRAKGLPGFLFDMYNDSALRLVEVRDLLNGQPWFDLTQPRLASRADSRCTGRGWSMRRLPG